MSESLRKFLNKIARKVDKGLDTGRVSPQFRTGFYYALAEIDEFRGQKKRKLGGQLKATKRRAEVGG